MNIYKYMQVRGKNIYIISIIILVLTTIFSLGYHHFDEHFQILEFAGLKLNLTTASNLPWEYHNQMRSSIQPAIVVYVHKFFGLFGVDNPFTITIFLRLISASLSFFSMWLIYKVYCKKISNQILSNWYLVLSFLLWFLVYINVRFSSENWSGTIFIIAFALFFSKKKQNALSYLSIGLILGFSFLFRYQVGFLIAGFLAWIIVIKKEKLLNIIYLIFGITLVILLGILLDKWYYGQWTITAWNYFEQNILRDKVSSFGVDPWWYYIEKFFIQAIPPFSILFILSTVLIFTFKKKSPITWSILPFLAVHFIIGHKEIRFLFPIVGFLPIIAIKGLEVIQQKFVRDLFTKRYLRLFMKGFFVVNFLFLIIITFRPADSQISLYRTIYNQYKTPTTLYFIDKNPYHRVLNINYYKRKKMEIRQINTLDSISNLPDRTSLIVFRQQKMPLGFEKKNKLIYSTFPEWIMKFNFNNWVERTNVWYVYELENESSKRHLKPPNW
ncbi:hypothetical protein JYT51_01495 [Candidatus Amoebophilus asiaticus]|nr:hypothetical protein [Candidatus Amoebophilus asiaticus]